MIRFRNSHIPILILTLIALTISINAEVPQLISYQGRLTDSGDNPLDTVVALLFTLYGPEGEVLWQEGHDGVTVTDGLFNVLLGSYANLPDNLFSGDTTIWLGITVGENPELEPRTRLTTVPYAYHALRADTAAYVAGAPAACGWVDDGSIVRLDDHKDTVRVGDYNGGAVVNISAGTSQFGLPTTGLGVWTENEGDSGTTAGYFSANADAGPARAIHANSSSATSDTVYAFKGTADNTSTGPAIGVYGEANNSNAGDIYGGYFKSVGYGSGARYGVHGMVEAQNDMFAVAVSGEGKNLSGGSITGGSFIVRSDGRGDKFGLSSRAENNGSSYTYGLATSAVNTGGGTVFGLYTNVTSSGHGKVYGGIFDAVTNADSSNYGLYSFSGGENLYGWYFGIYAEAENRGLSGATAGNFWASDAGSGVHYGVFGYEAAGGNGAAIYASGDFVASGTKSAVMRTSNGTTLMYAMESSEVWFEDFGEGQLISGKAHIELDPLFLETVTIDHDNPMKVFVQLNDDCNGTYVKTSLTGFDVLELHQGASEASFTYRVVAKRKGYEAERMRVTEVGHDDPQLFPERADEIYEKMKQRKQAETSHE